MPQSERIKRKYYELYANEFNNFEENDPFLERPKIPVLTKKETDNLQSNVKEITFLQLIPSPNGFTGELYQRFNEVIVSILYKLIQKIDKEKTVSSKNMEYLGII